MQLLTPSRRRLAFKHEPVLVSGQQIARVSGKIEDVQAPRVFLVRLDVHDLDEQDIARLSGLDLERPRQVVDFGQVNIFHIVGAIIVP